MTTVLLSLHLIITVSLIFLILLQKSEGNAAGGGMGGGVSITSMMQPRSRPNALTRATGILALSFFATSIALAVIAQDAAPPASILAPAAVSGDVPKVSESVLETPAVPDADAAPAAPAVPTGPN